jgi:hypothetical protein
VLEIAVSRFLVTSLIVGGGEKLNNLWFARRWWVIAE